MFYFPAAQLISYPDLETEAKRSFALLEKAVIDTCGEKDAAQNSLASWAFVHGWADLGVQNLFSKNTFSTQDLENSIENFVRGMIVS
jgi:hypothetical protein